MVQVIPIESIDQIYADDRVKIIDIRPTSAYNGWALHNEKRGGHIPGSIAFPYDWSAKAFDKELVERLERRGITPADPVLVYDYGDEDAHVFADRLEVLGYDQVSVLKGGFTEWAAREDLGVVSLANYHQLVYPEWLSRVLAGESVEAAPAGDVLVFHVNYGVPQDYARGHIPGAFHLDTNLLESSRDWNRRPPHELEEALTGFGITTDTPVVLYGNDTARDPREDKPGRRAGQIAATRAAAILTYAGVEDVRLLDGGLNAWRAQGHPIETVARVPRPVRRFGARIPARSDVFIDYEEAVDLLADPRGALVSIRSKPENVGKTSGYNYITERGDIPGAVWGDNGSDAYHMENYRNVDNTMREFNEIAVNWEKAGITPDKRVSFYCGTGWRASETFFYALLMGWPDISIYDGGWFEWSRINGTSR